MQIVSFSLLLALLISATQGFSLVSPVERKLGKQNGVNLIVSLREGTSGVIEGIKSRKFATRQQRHVALVDSLKEHSSASQKPVLEFLKKEKLIKPALRLESLWITNQIVIKGADLNLISRLSALPQVSAVKEEAFLRLEQPKGIQVLEALVASESSSDNDYGGNGDGSSGRNVIKEEQQWGVVTIQAPEVWSKGNTGQNVTVCTIGTGALASHEALRDNFLGEFGWYDPLDGTSIPEDPLGVGTHTIGTMVGSLRGIGVAPGSKWSACKACAPPGVCSTIGILSCAEWVLCPNPDDACSKAPRVVNNVWGGGSSNGDDFFDEVLQAWTTAGIIPIFPIGGSGTCNSTSAPGNSEFAIGVGATTSLDSLYEATSSGPGPKGRIKPDVVAPGQNVLSAYSVSDTSYASISGTSVAAPHVAGLVALILHQNPDATFHQVRAILGGGAENTKPSFRECGGIPESQLPNFVVGYGRVNALKSLSSR